VDKDRSGAISVTELQSALVNGDWTRFDLDTVKMLMNMFDTDRSGTIGFPEFKGLWKYIADWQGVFRHFDADRSGSIEGRELAEALRSFGYNLSPNILTLVEHKYCECLAFVVGVRAALIRRSSQHLSPPKEEVHHRASPLTDSCGPVSS
jgi:Ca2+-binding EF-hand superfamily protein